MIHQVLLVRNCQFLRNLPGLCTILRKPEAELPHVMHILPDGGAAFLFPGKFLLKLPDFFLPEIIPAVFSLHSTISLEFPPYSRGSQQGL